MDWVTVHNGLQSLACSDVLRTRLAIPDFSVEESLSALKLFAIHCGIPDTLSITKLKDYRDTDSPELCYAAIQILSLQIPYDIMAIGDFRERLTQIVKPTIFSTVRIQKETYHKRKRFVEEYHEKLLFTPTEYRTMEHNRKPLAERLSEAMADSEDTRLSIKGRSDSYESVVVILMCDAFPDIGRMWIQFLVAGDTDDMTNNYMNTKDLVLTIRKKQKSVSHAPINLNVPVRVAKAVQSLYTFRRINDPTITSSFVFVRSKHEEPSTGEISTIFRHALGHGMCTRLVNKLHATGMWNMNGFETITEFDKRKTRDTENKTNECSNLQEPCELKVNEPHPVSEPSKETSAIKILNMLITTTRKRKPE